MRIKSNSIIVYKMNYCDNLLLIALQASAVTTNTQKPTQPLPGGLNSPPWAMTIDWGVMQFEQWTTE